MTLSREHPSECLCVCVCVWMSACVSAVCVCVCKEFEGKSLLFTWIYGVVIGRVYDMFIGVYIMVWIGGHRFSVCFTDTDLHTHAHTHNLMSHS